MKIFRKNSFVNFWNAHPALYVGLALLLGAAAASDWHWGLLLALSALLLARPPAACVLLAACAFFYVRALHPPHEALPRPVESTALFSPSSLTIHSSPFQRSYLYQGTLAACHTASGAVLHNLPCRIFLPLTAERPPADADYILSGSLIQKRSGAYLFKPTAWRPLPNTLSFAEWRFRAKEAAHAYFKNHFSHERSASFLAALATGDLDDRTLSYEFGNLGLQHILAISGFHFALVAAFLGSLFRLVLPRKGAAALLIALLSAYWFFLGNTPSIQRAWVAITIVLLGRILELRSNGLNALGVGLIVEILLDPLCVSRRGFQLSFLAAAAILLLYKEMDRFLEILLPKRSLEAAVRLPFLHQHLYILTSLIRQSLALNLSVHLAAIPTLLYLYHTFPWLSLIYNLFFPFWVSVSMALLLLGLLLPGIHAINNTFTFYLLELTAHPLPLLGGHMRVPHFPFSLLVAILSSLFLFGVFLRGRARA
jgi:competence protein ComEC